MSTSIPRPTASPIRPDMFQCMVETSNKNIQMRNFFSALCEFQTDRIKHFTSADIETRMANVQTLIQDQTVFGSPIDRIRARAPGSLGQSVKPDDLADGATYVIGSISIRVCLWTTGCCYSVFIFSSGKVKISGGSATFEEHGCEYSAWLEEHVVRQILDIPIIRAYVGDMQSWKIFLLNGTGSIQNLGQVQMATYRDLCSRIANKIPFEDDIFTSVTLPAIMTPNYRNAIRKSTSGGGRICSISLKYGKRGTVRFDHGCIVQFMGFRSIGDMEEAFQALVRLLHQCRSTQQNQIQNQIVQTS